jgi:hypothetical protein
MILEEIRNIRSTSEDLRGFGLVVGGVLAVIGLVLLIKGSGAYVWFIGIGAFLIASGLAVPALLKPLYLPWMALSVVLGWVMTRVLLLLLYFVVLMPIGLVSRAFGKKFLDYGRRDPSIESHWNRREGQADPRSCTRLY